MTLEALGFRDILSSRAELEGSGDPLAPYLQLGFDLIEARVL